MYICILHFSEILLLPSKTFFKCQLHHFRMFLSLRNVSLTFTFEETLIIEPITEVIAISKLGTDVSEK